LVPANLDQPFNEFIQEATRRRFLVIRRAGMAIGTPIGAQASIFEITPGEKIEELFGHLNA
jgi:hypothetical protein